MANDTLEMSGFLNSYDTFGLYEFFRVIDTFRAFGFLRSCDKLNWAGHLVQPNLSYIYIFWVFCLQ